MELQDVLLKLKEQGVSTVQIHRIENIAKEFATPEAFFLATRGSIQTVYNKMRPDSPKGLGDRFFNVFDKALRLFHQATTPEIAAKRVDQLGRTVSKDDLLLVAELMEKFQRETVTLRWILQQLELAKTE